MFEKEINELKAHLDEVMKYEAKCLSALMYEKDAKRVNLLQDVMRQLQMEEQSTREAIYALK